MSFLKKNCDLIFDRHLFAHKAFCVQFSLWPEHSPDLYIRFRASTKGDHAGINLSWQVGHLMLDIDLYDERHWDDDNDTWHEPGVV